MLEALRHRGPDDRGAWTEQGAWLGHRRLSIIDLSPAGHQPMISGCGRWVLVINGEIYNFEALRREVEAAGPVSWRGRSDTEVFLEAIARLGVLETLERARGMFAFAAWDRHSRTLYLARDPFGEKPLCYATSGGELAFASEVGALDRASPSRRELSPQALSLYFQYGYVPAPYSIHAGVSKLPPGCLLTWREGREATVTPFFSAAELVEAGRRDPLVDPQRAVDSLDAVLREAVGDQMMSDVPLGAFLSGGIDSTLVVALMQSLAGRPVETFTLGFESPEYDEAPYAARVAAHLGTRHTQHYVGVADALALAPRMGAVFDEPFADASQIPTYLISGLARRKVTVCLTGDGGDELFAGYVRYPGVPRLWKTLRRIPFRAAAGRLLAAAPLGLLDAGVSALRPLARQYSSRGRVSPDLRRAARWMSARDFRSLYERTMSAWTDPAKLLRHPGPGASIWRPPAPSALSDLDFMLWRDAVDYLPGDILCKVDRCAMAHGLETRAPLLDPRVAALAWRAPAGMRIRGGETKWLLRRVLDRYVPRELVERPKMGLSVPLHDWLTGGLRAWAEDLVGGAVIRRQGLLNPHVVEKVWRGYIAGDTSLNHQVWSLLMFQSWLAERGR